jgi:single-strand DNA-binding protein
MAAGDTQLTLVGNVVTDVQLRFTPNGQPVANFRIASTPRYLDRQSDTWKDGESLFLTCNVWRQQAENAAESIEKGMRVIVQGRLKQRSYEKDGEKRTVFEVEVDEVGPSLKNATAKVAKTQRQSGGGGFGSDQSQPQGGFGQQQGSQQGGQQAPQGGNPPADDPWATNQPPAAGGGGFSDEPPF